MKTSHTLPLPQTQASPPKICLTLTEASLASNLEILSRNLPYVDMCELRVDFLLASELASVTDFPRNAGLPVILTVRRPQDGGKWAAPEEEREQVLAHLLQQAPLPFAYVDLEADFHRPALEDIARKRGTKIIRSLHDFKRPIPDIVGTARELKGNSEDIPKLAFAVPHCSDMEQVFRQTADFTEFPHIICAMGSMGQSARILAAKTHSMLTFATAPEAMPRMGTLGLLTPEALVNTYNFRALSSHTQIYAVTGWPVEHSISPELHNPVYAKEKWDTVMVRLPAETAADALKCAEAMKVRGLAVTVPHKKEMLRLMASLSSEAEAIGAVNTVVATSSGWHGANTDIPGFQKALLDFLHCESLNGRKVAILGAGGAANAVAFVIARLGGKACIFNRTLDKAQMLAAPYGFRAAPLESASVQLLTEYSDIIVQATSVGLSSRQEQNGQSDPIPFYQFRGKEHLYDLIYSPAVTPIMARAQKAGCQTENGLSMLVAQAAEQRKLFRAGQGAECREKS